MMRWQRIKLQKTVKSSVLTKLITNKSCLFFSPFLREQINKKNSNLRAPLRRPSFEFSKAAFVISLKAEVIAPDAAKPARKD